ncbi:MAG: hypothetical protein GTO63_30285 [Anaerolineae bacterium]|nr:hypothetical protein [Anaerolineae bacterium]NIN98994.1 hypothetical protein [Anaerolineae bacterium]
MKWRVLKVLQQGVVSDPVNPELSGRTTKLLVEFAGRGEVEVELAPTIDIEGVRRTLDSMAEAGAPQFVTGPPADDLQGMAG